MVKDELLQGLTLDQIEKAKACKNQKELLGLAIDEGVELTDEQLQAVTGGNCVNAPASCPLCSYPDIESLGAGVYKCRACGHKWHRFDNPDQEE